MKTISEAFRYLVVALQGALTTILCATILKFSILAAWQNALVVAFLIILFLLTSWKLIFPFVFERKSEKKTPRLVTLILFTLLSLLVSVSAEIAYHYFGSVSTFVEGITTSEDTVEKDLTNTPFIVYISGTDSRDGIDGYARSDVNILAVVNPTAEKILLVTIPRDTYVQLHGTTGIKDKLTHAGSYSLEMSKATIEDFLDITIDYTVKVSFETVVKIVDVIGGIDINSDTAMTLNADTGQFCRDGDESEACKTAKKTCSYVEGWNHLDGTCALRYSRERKTYYTGDNHRGQNQQQVLTAIINKISSEKSLLLSFPAILKAAENTFHTSFTYDDITSLLRFELTKTPNWQIESIQIEGTARYAGTYTIGEATKLYVMDASEDSTKSAREKIDKYLNL